MSSYCARVFRKLHRYFHSHVQPRLQHGPVVCERVVPALGRLCPVAHEGLLHERARAHEEGTVVVCGMVIRHDQLRIRLQPVVNTQS